MNLANLGLAGLMVAQNRMQTAGHNINNADTVGYNRQSVLAATAGASATSAGYIGRGVQAVTVQRAYDNFLQQQLVAAQSKGAALASYGSEISQINNLFADRTVGITPALQKFFDGVQAVASAPADSAARQELLGRANSLVSQLQQANSYLDEQRGNINTQLGTVVNQINSYVERVNDLNKQITIARATNTHEPNDLLDQRDQLVSELSQLADVKVIEQDGSFNLTIGHGHVLLGGSSVYPLRAQASEADPSRFVVAYTVPGADGKLVAAEMREDAIQGGTLSGLLAYRREALDTVQNELGRTAMALAIEFNKIHKNGYDLDNAEGLAFFTEPAIKAMPAAGNSATSLSVNVTDPSHLTAQDYRIAYEGGQYTITRLPNGTPTPLPADGKVDGLEFTFDPATATEGDSWVVQPTRNAAAGLSVAITDPAKIAAAAKDTGTANGDNALALGKLQTAKVLGRGSMSLNESYSQIVNRVGVLTQQNATASKAQLSLIQQNYSAQQAVSGVNLDEESINLDRFQQQYQAAARLIDVSSKLFDTLLGLRA